MDLIYGKTQMCNAVELSYFHLGMNIIFVTLSSAALMYKGTPYFQIVDILIRQEIHDAHADVFNGTLDKVNESFALNLDMEALRDGFVYYSQKAVAGNDHQKKC